MNLKTRGRSRPIGRVLVRLALCSALLLTVTPSSQAGFMDSITGVFSGITEKVKGFFGGKKSAAENPEFEKFLEQVETSQQTLHSAQTEAINYLNENPETVGGEDAQSQEFLNAVSDASRTNEDLYLQYLKARSDAQSQKIDLATYQERIDGVQENQKRLEEGFQSIQDFSKDAGLFTPPADVHASMDNSGNFSPDDPTTQKYIDEWLGANGLDPYGRLVGSVNGGIIRANYGADTDGRTRAKYVWEEYWQMQGPLTGSTLGDYVKSRMAGGEAVQKPPQTQDPSTSIQVATKPEQAGANIYGDGGSQDVADIAIQANPEETGTDSALASVTSELNQAVKDLQDLQKAQKGSTPEAQALLEKISKLQGERNGLVNASQ